MTRRIEFFDKETEEPNRNQEVFIVDAHGDVYELVNFGYGSHDLELRDDLYWRVIETE